MAQETTISFKVAPTGTSLTDIPVTVTVNGEATTEITATLSATANGVTALKNISNVVCFDGGNGNSNAATVGKPQIYTLTINGLEYKKLTNISVLNKALDSGGNYQGTVVPRKRHYSISYGSNAENLTELTDEIRDISIYGESGSTEKTQNFSIDNEKTTNTFVVQLKLYNISSEENTVAQQENGTNYDYSLGCFFGLTGFKLTLRDYSYTLSQLTASELMEKTEPTYIAIKNVAKNNNVWLDIKNEANANNSNSQFGDDVIFVWEPATEGEAGKYYIKDLDGNYLQMYTSYTAGHTGTDVKVTLGTKDNAAIFKSVNATNSGSGSTLFNDSGSDPYINGGNDENLVRFITLRDDNGTEKEGYWINSQQPTQQAVYNEGKGGFTIHYVYEATEVTDFTVNITDAQFATFYAPVNVVLPNNATAYIIDGVKEDNWLNLVEVTGILPANTGVLLHSESEVDCSLAVTSNAATATVTNNKLAGTINDSFIKKEDNYSYYILSKDTEGNVGMLNPVLGENTNKFKNYANKAYLKLTTAQGTAAFYGFNWNGTTGISEVKGESGNVKVIFDLTGRRVENISAPGIYVVGGRKVLVK